MSLTLDEARARAAQLSDVSYDLELDLTSDGPTFGSRVRVGFASTGPETFLEVIAAAGLAVQRLVNGRRLGPGARPGRLFA